MGSGKLQSNILDFNYYEYMIPILRSIKNTKQKEDFS
jgi:hypothetical protein